MEGLATRLDGITKERGNSRPAHEIPTEQWQGGRRKGRRAGKSGF